MQTLEGSRRISRATQRSRITRLAGRLLPALGLLALSACDNINWGGVEIAIVPPPEISRTPSTSGDEIAERMPEGPILYYVANGSDGAVLMPVGEISGDTLLPIRARGDASAFAQRLIADHLRQGSEFVLFRNGNRVGTMVVESAEPPPPGTCPALPRARGTMELAAGADQVPEFIAIANPYAPEIRRRAGPVPEPNRTMQVLGPILAEQMIRARRAPLPGNWQNAMRQLKPFPVSGASDPGFATTFLVSDSLGRGGDNEGYSLFFIGIPAQFSYDTVFVHFTNYAQDGKASPRVIDFLDWNRDDQPDLLLQVYGINDVWFETVGKTQNGSWRSTFRDRCESGPSTMPDPLGRDTTTRDTTR